MYKEGDKLTLLQPVGRINNTNYIEKGSTVEFIKVIDTDDISKSYVIVRYKNRALTVPEAAVKLQEGILAKVFPYFSTYSKNMRSYNRSLMKHNPRLRMHHHNLIIRFYYKLFYLIYDRFTKSPKKRKDLDRVKRVVNGD